MVSVVVLNTCLCVVFLSNVSKGGVGCFVSPFWFFFFFFLGGERGGGGKKKGGGGGGGGQGGVAFYGKRSPFP